MTVKEMKSIIENLPDDTEIKINSVWNENIQELTAVSCSGFYHEQQTTVFLTPDQIAL